MMDILLKPGDVFFTRGTSCLSHVIRVCTRSFGERQSKVNHVGVVVEQDGVQTAVVVEALSKVRKHRLWERYGPPKKDHVAVYRANNLNAEQIEIIIAEANEQVGRPYGYVKIIAHLLDWLLNGAYVFRRLTSDPRYPICSWLVAHSYSKAGKHFGVAPVRRTRTTFGSSSSNELTFTNPSSMSVRSLDSHLQQQNRSPR